MSQRLYGVVFQKVKSVAMSQPFEVEVTSSYAPDVDQAGNLVGFADSWLLKVAVPNPVIGHPAIAISVPIKGVLPPDMIFERVAEELFKRCMEEKDKLLAKPAAVGMDLTKVGK